ncbi:MULTISPECIES: type II toxin-antitoxin system VapC family toxin [unclassified Roseofilum]|uniref:type II toxin-antitoxin system VapC family toxin n=1 Tax=unclassified Roseofilum TaxID=2620099 RepID=UPI000E821B25|nr:MULTISPECIES: type II toxin-antitoxin system VapC family toxin [unclassified Roseofilum]MBP0010885.1 type II toxin-antitoxin system VapC family toxin [Roseofilum sp. Belize Diploria]MBP0032030.1 type II toxin-antitoxin system VapC family toxin [Roseofilum sp. Belize BBD 4]HBQ98296.1 PIN domain nuclease [Cyanobacteria bacterium UBA11691]
MLLDTHTLLWFLADDPKLPSRVKSSIENADRVRVSMATVWEIAIKISIKKLKLDFEFMELADFLAQTGIETLDISFADLEHYRTLPLHHRDPFDRILIAQAITNSLMIVSADTAFNAYPIQRMWT